MRLTQKLLGHLNRVFKTEPAQFLALRLSYDGSMSWRIEDATLYTSVTGGSGGDLEVDLTQFTISALVAYLAFQPGYSVLYVDGSELSTLSARVLIDDAKDIDDSNGDHLYGYTNVVWSFFEWAAGELAAAAQQITNALLQMSTVTASDIWLDELGGYYGIPRLAGELDSSYGPRIIAEVLRPRGNNVAIEIAIEAYTGQNVQVTNVTEYGVGFGIHNASFTHDSSHTYGTVARPIYGLFDVDYGYDLIEGGDFDSFATVVRGLIERLRDAGTHLRSLSLTGSVLSDSAAAPVDQGDMPLIVDGVLEDSPDAPSEASVMAIALATAPDAVPAAADELLLDTAYGYVYSGARRYDGSFIHVGGTVGEETL